MGCTLHASAASSEVGMLYDCNLTVGCVSNGIAIDIETNATKAANEIGYKNVVLVEKNGSSIREIAIPSGSTSGKASYGDSYIYTGAVPGRSYYAYCTHYAVYGSTTKEVYNSTDPLVYN